MTKEEREVKIDWLNSYRYVYLQYRKYVDKIQKLRNEANNMTANYSDMPHGSGTSNPQNVWVTIIDTENELADELERVAKEAKKQYREIENSIENLKCPIEKSILRLRYILGMRWKDIWQAIGYSERQTFFYHNLALEHIEIPVGTYWVINF